MGVLSHILVTVIHIHIHTPPQGIPPVRNTTKPLGIVGVACELVRRNASNAMGLGGMHWLSIHFEPLVQLELVSILLVTL